MAADHSLAEEISEKGSDNVVGDLIVAVSPIWLYAKNNASSREFGKYQAPKLIPAGTILLMTAVANNSNVDILYDEQMWSCTTTNKLFYIHPEELLNKATFCITGKLKHARDYYGTLIHYKGGLFKKSVTRNTDYLITGENVGENKCKKAASYGTKILTEDDFFKLLDLKRVQ